MGRPLMSRKGDLAMLSYFVLHIPLTLLFDAQFLAPEFTRSHWPAFLLDAVQDYLRDSNDFLVKLQPAWFMSFLTCEMLFQLPLNLIMVHALATDAPHTRTTGIIYSVHTATTMVPILTEVFLGPGAAIVGQTQPQWLYMAAIYFIWLAVPLLILAAMLARQPTHTHKLKKE
ncbi:hypothetical protein HDU77_011196 [Chytriomyces hyalinus]|nr:hypothetical protein HDU77_011196 [Chytriomyces hyalinus]